MEYRFPTWKDAPWNSFERQKERYEAIRPFIGLNQIGAEIGVYKGGFGEFLLGHCQKLYLVDPWYRAQGFWRSDIESDSRVDTVIEILRVYKKEIEEKRVEVIVDYAENFLRSVNNGHLDFVYVDSSHNFTDTLLQLRLAQPKLNSGGRLFGDDYDPKPKSKQHGVYRAVNQFAEEQGAKLILKSKRQWGIAID